jgi:acetyl esterase/lipase
MFVSTDTMRTTEKQQQQQQQQQRQPAETATTTKKTWMSSTTPNDTTASQRAMYERRRHLWHSLKCNAVGGSKIRGDEDDDGDVDDDDRDPILTFRNIAYSGSSGGGSDETLTMGNNKRRQPSSRNPHLLDVYVRKSVMNPYNLQQRPIIINLHGGAWLIGDKDIINVENNCYLFARQNYISVSIRYTLSSISNRMLLYTFAALTVVMMLLGIMSNLRQSARLAVIWLVLAASITTLLFSRGSNGDYVDQRHPSHIRDVARAARWVRDNAALFGGSPAMGMSVVGHSAGAHLAALLVCNPEYLNEVGMQPRDFAAAVCMAGVYNDHRLRNNNMIGRTLLSEAFGDNRQVHTAAFPIYHCDPSQVPPMFLLNSGRDISLKRHSKEFRSQLLQNGVYCDSRVYPSTNHYTMTLQWDRENHGILRDILSFLERALEARRRRQHEEEQQTEQQRR